MTQKRKSAFFAAVEQAREPAADSHKLNLPSKSGQSPASDTAQREKAPQPENQGEQLEKVTFYLSPAQVEKLYDLVHDYRKRTGIRVNRNDIIRRLVDLATLETVLP